MGSVKDLETHTFLREKVLERGAGGELVFKGCRVLFRKDEKFWR